MEIKKLKEDLKISLGRNSFKDFWEWYLKDIIGYQYFITQLNGAFKLNTAVEKIIENYLAEK